MSHSSAYTRPFPIRAVIFDAAVSGILRDLLANKVEIELAGGKLQIEWKEGDVVWMTGPTATVYEGQLDLNYFQS